MDHTTAIGTVAGTALTVSVNITSADLTRTVLLAMVGAVVSFTVSVFLKWVWKKVRSVFSK